MAKSEKKEKNKRFFKDFKAELKKVVWPTSKQIVNNTTAVITIVLITAIIVFVLDFTFNALNEYGINQIRSKIESSDTTQTEDSAESEATENVVEDSGNVLQEETVENEVVEE